MNTQADSSFRESDKKLYNLATNAEFLNGLEVAIQEGYDSLISIPELQKMIDKITYWYEFKYPEKEDSSKDILKMSRVMSKKQLLDVLTDKEIALLKSNYRSSDFGFKSVYENGRKVGMKEYLSIRVKCRENDPRYQKHAYFKIIVDPSTGIVEKDRDLTEYIGPYDVITIDEVLNLLEPYNEMLDLSILERCVFNHVCDLNLRDKILELISLSLIYSINTTVKKGHERARKFIYEFNKYFGLNLSCSSINETKKKYDEMIKKWHGMKPLNIDSCMTFKLDD